MDESISKRLDQHKTPDEQAAVSADPCVDILLEALSRIKSDARHAIDGGCSMDPHLTIARIESTLIAYFKKVVEEEEAKEKRGSKS